MRRLFIAILCLIGSLCGLEGQVFSPRVLKAGQPDTTDLAALARGIAENAHAHTPREKAEAIWRFFLTDGRFVKPGMIYHIAGWAYEEPGGEVLDPVKLLHSYGFGLCYHVAPLLESAFKSAGFADARVWFLTGHTVAEVFYEGGYHYFDSDMMGYNPMGTSGPVKGRPVASVHQIEQDGRIITGKLAGPKQADVANVDSPWYPADVRAHAIDGLAELFTTTNDNWVYPFQRYQSGHTMDFVLRPGERIVRHFQPQSKDLYYLPYKFDGKAWTEFPQEIEQYKIRTSDGPQSQKDSRQWATGTQEYRPPAMANDTAVYAMPSSYVIIDAGFQMAASLPASGSIQIETSVDGGHEWLSAAKLTGPHQGAWSGAGAVLTKSEHGNRNAVSGSYGYLVRISKKNAQITDLVLTTRFQLNPRTLPELTAGQNELTYASTGVARWEVPVTIQNVQREAVRLANAEPIFSGGQGYFVNKAGSKAEMIFALESPDGGEINGLDAGARFLDLRDGLAPDKFTAEIRKVSPWPAKGTPQQASIEWSTSIDGRYETAWAYDPKLKWRDGESIDRTLRWPEVDRTIRDLPKGTKRVYVRYRFQGLAFDAPRMAVVRDGMQSASPLQITQIWTENGIRRERRETIAAGQMRSNYKIGIPANANVVNEELVLEVPADGPVIPSRQAPRDEPLVADPDAAFWRGVPATMVSTDNFARQQVGYETEVRSRWTASNLYFQFTSPYKELYLHPKPSRTVETNGLWDWDVAEVFIGADFGNIKRYKEFEMSPQGEWVDLDIDLARPHPADGWTWNSGFQVTASIDQRTSKWYGAMRIPYGSVDERAAALGNLLRFNFYREQGPPARRVEIAWQPTMNRSYHVPERFGTLRLSQ